MVKVDRGDYSQITISHFLLLHFVDLLSLTFKTFKVPGSIHLLDTPWEFFLGQVTWNYLVDFGNMRLDPTRSPPLDRINFLNWNFMEI